MAKKKKAVRHTKSTSKRRTKNAAKNGSKTATPPSPVPAVASSGTRSEAWFVRHNTPLEGMIGGPFVCEVIEERSDHCLLVAVDAGIGRLRQEVLVPPSEIELLERDDRRKVLETLPANVLALLAREYLLPTGGETGSVIDQLLNFEFGSA